MTLARWIGFDRHGEHAGAGAGKNGNCAGIGGIFQRDGVTGTQKRFADQVDGLLAAVGDQELLGANVLPFAPEPIDKLLAQRLVAVGRAERKNAAAFAA